MENPGVQDAKGHNLGRIEMLNTAVKIPNP